MHFSESKIIKTHDQQSNLIQFFDVKVLETSLLYRASDSNFNTSVFF